MKLSCVWAALLQFQLSLELLDFIFEFTKKGILGILINSGSVANVLGSVCIAEGAEGFFKVVICWPDVRNLKEVEDMDELRTGD
jgi:hypothetical protein